MKFSRALADVVDTTLDRTVVPGYSRLGPLLRRHWWPADPVDGSLVGKRVIVTGASAGLGMSATVGLTRLGATVHMVGRSEKRMREAAAKILDAHPDSSLVVEECDVSDLDAARAYAADLTGRLGSLHAVVHNAGVLPPQRTESAQGHELTLATHVLGPLLMTALLRDLLAADGDARVVWVSSGGMYVQPFTHEIATDLEYERGEYSGTAAYARTKRMQVIVAEQLARLLSPPLVRDRVTVHSMHPGWADTPGITASLPRFSAAIGPLLRSAAEGADTIVWLAAAPEAVETSGRFWCDRRPRPTSYLPWQREDPTDRILLWERCLEAVGITA